MRNVLGVIGITLGIVIWLAVTAFLYLTVTGQLILLIGGVLLMIGIPIVAALDTIWD